MTEAIVIGMFVFVLVAGCRVAWTRFKLRQRIKRLRDQRCSEKLAREAIYQLGLPWKHLGGPLWVAASEPRHGFRVELKVFANNHFVSMVADAHFHIEPEFVSRDLLWFLLEKNTRCTVGSFGVCPTHLGYEITHSHQCDGVTFTPQMVTSIARTLVNQMEDAIESLHTKQLI